MGEKSPVTVGNTWKVCDTQHVFLLIYHYLLMIIYYCKAASNPLTMLAQKMKYFSETYQRHQKVQRQNLHLE